MLNSIGMWSMFWRKVDRSYSLFLSLIRRNTVKQKQWEKVQNVASQMPSPWRSSTAILQKRNMMNQLLLMILIWNSRSMAFWQKKKYDCKSIRWAPSIVLPDAKDGWQGQNHGKRQNKVQPPTSVYSVKMQKMIPCSKYSRLWRCKFCLVPMSGMRKMRKKTTPRQLNHPVIHPPITPFS